MYCDGHCDTWLHRGCAGLSKLALKEVANSSDPFYCTRCCLSKHKEELETLRTIVTKLTSELVSVRSTLSEVAGKVTPTRVSSLDVPHASGPSNGDSPSDPVPSTQKQYSSSRKFNIVLHGLAECPKDTPRHARLTSDFSKTSSLLRGIDPDSQSPPCVRDCRRLGKYNASRIRPRPVLVTLSSTAEVNNILFNRRNLTSPEFIKPDLSPADRKIQSLLLTERRKLLDSGTDRSSIKIRKSSLYLNGKLYGSVVDSTFQFSSSLADLAPGHGQPANVSLPSSSISQGQHNEA